MSRNKPSAIHDYGNALLNKSAVARLIGLKQRTLNARIKNRTPLTPKEAERL